MLRLRIGKVAVLKKFTTLTLYLLVCLFLSACSDQGPNLVSPQPTTVSVDTSQTTPATVANTPDNAFPSQAVPTVPATTQVPETATPTIAPWTAKVSPLPTPTPSVTPALSAEDKLMQTISATTTTVSDVARGDNIIVLSPDGNMLASFGHLTTTNKPGILFWSATTGKVVGEIDDCSDKITSLRFSPDGSMLAAASDNGTVQLWSVTNAKLISTLDVVKDVVIYTGPSSDNDALIQLAFSPDSKTIATVADGNSLEIWDVASSNLLNTTSGSFDDIAFSPDSSTIATFHRKYYYTSKDGETTTTTVDAWSLANSQLTHTTSINAHQNEEIRGIYFAGSNKSLIALDADGTVQYLSVDKAKLLHTESIMPANIESVFFNSASNIIVSVPHTNISDFMIEGANLNQPKAVFKLKGNHTVTSDKIINQGNSSLSFSGDGQKLAALGSDGLVEIYDLAAKKQLINFLIIPDLVQSSRLLDGGKSIALAYCNRIDVWDTNSLKLTHTLPITSFAYISFDQDGQYFAEVIGSTSVIKELSTGKTVKVLPTGITDNQFIWQFGFSGLDQPFMVFDYNSITKSFEIRKLDLQKPQTSPTIVKIMLVDEDGDRLVASEYGFAKSDVPIDPAKSIALCDAYTFNSAGTTLTGSNCNNPKYATLSIP